MFFLGSPNQTGGVTRNSSNHTSAAIDDNTSVAASEPISSSRGRRSSFSFTDIRDSATKILKNRRQSMGGALPSSESPGKLQSNHAFSDDRQSVGYSQQLLSSAATSPDKNDKLDEWDSIAPKLEHNQNHHDDCSTVHEDDDYSDHQGESITNQQPLGINDSADNISNNHCGYVIDCAGGSDYPFGSNSADQSNTTTKNEGCSINDSDLLHTLEDGNNCIIRPRVKQPTEELVEKQRTGPRTVHISQLPRCPKELAVLFMVDSPSIFEGG